MKRVFSDPREVAHLWMAQSQDSAKCGNVFFDGKTIYSYGHHFPIATVATNEAGARAVLITTRGYSPSTSRHISYVKRAIDYSLPVFNVSNPWRYTPTSREISGMLTDYRERIKSTVETVKPRTREATRLQVFGRVQSLVNEANRYAEFFGLGDRIEMPDSLAVVMANIADAEKRSQELAETARRKAETKLKRINATYRRVHAGDLEAWRATGNERFYDSSRDCMRPLDFAAWRATNGDLLRYDSTTNEVHTSQGATVPVEHARKAFLFVQSVRNSGKAWQTNGHTFHIGPYRLETVSVKGDIKAGCHNIQWAEILALATAMDWTNSPVATVTDSQVSA